MHPIFRSRSPLRPALAVAALLAGAAPVASPAAGLSLAQWGATAGLGSWTQSFDYDGEQLFDPADRISGFAGGIWFDLGRSTFFPRVEALYQQRGTRDQSPRADEQGQIVGLATQEVRAHYLSIPISVLAAKRGGSIVPYVGAGVGAEFLLQTQHDSVGVQDQLNRTALGLHLQAGFERGKAGVMARYFRDLTNPYPGVENGTLTAVRNEGWILLLTMKLGPVSSTP
ncbi:MAG: outer membrane beta-barrel protein [Gemmatimonadetes bacterium]|nr:outer membrane beta-barrel protein [Gemmatimonadota bacterium]